MHYSVLLGARRCSANWQFPEYLEHPGIHRLGRQSISCIAGGFGSRGCGIEGVLPQNGVSSVSCSGQLVYLLLALNQIINHQIINTLELLEEDILRTVHKEYHSGAIRYLLLFFV